MNTSGDSNRSVRKTKSSLKQALVKLLAEKPASSITVREITSLADVSRGTFYLYYRDVFDMVASCQSELLAEFANIIGKIDVCCEDVNYTAVLSTLELVGENSEMFGVLMGPNGSNDFINAMGDILEKPLANNIGRLTGNENIVSLLRGFFVRGFLGLVEAWLKDGMKESPENLASILTGLLDDTKKLILEKTDSSQNS